ncbi:MAG: thioredoxin [Flavobacteriaceae bacterium]|nr:thioredoxin [Flavobacteriaceae bacterium]|tara:strand:- start:1897 stop:2415 length:519 start_codon:yes stop_codon:yes gene_type:complete
MSKKFPFFILFAMLLSCKGESPKTVDQKQTNSEIVQTLNYQELKPLLEKQDGKNYVVNFWATWCAPCVKELPYFEALASKYSDKNIEVLLVSLDFPKQKDTRLLPFMKKKNIKSKVVLLDDMNEDVWIKAISEEWSGALPATLFYNANNRKFYEQSFTEEELHKELENFLNL